MTCGRCNGLMVDEWFCDLLETGNELCVGGYRCLLCGNLVDAVILENRQRSADSIGSTALKSPCLPRSLLRPERKSSAEAHVLTAAI